MRRDDVEHTLDVLASEVEPPRADPSAVLERGRHRIRQRRLTLTGVVTALVAVVAVVGLVTHDDSSKTPTLRTAEHETGPVVGARSPQIAAPTALEAWKCRNPIEYTHDGGRTWRATELAGVPDGDLQCTAVAGGTAWALAGGDAAAHERIFRVRDGGAHVDAFDFPGVGATSGPTFVDADHGWLGVFSTARTARGVELYRTVDGGETWSRATSGDQPLRSTSFANADVGWTINGSSILRTADTGATWLVKHHTAGSPFAVVATPNGAVVWAGTPITAAQYRPYFDVTTDGGATWAQRQGPADFERANARNLFSASDATHWQFVSGSGLRVTEDAGHSWEARPDIPMTTYPSTMTFPTPDVGWLTDDRGSVLRTADGGRTWSNVTAGGEHPLPSPTPPQPVPIPITFVSQTEGWLCSGRTMLYTTDAGANWKSVAVPSHPPTPPRSQLPVCAAIPGGEAWMLTASADGRGLQVIHVTDGGRNGETSAFPELGSDWTVRNLAFADTDHGWAYATDAAGGASTMLATTDGGRTWDYTTPTRGVTLFASPREGWAALDLLPSELAHTTDGGRTWERVPTLYHSDIELRPIGATRGAVVALAWSPSYTETPPSFAVSKNGGGYWVQRRAPRELATTPPEQIAASATDADHWQVAAGSKLWTTDTGGRSWRPVADFAGVSAITDVDFPTADLGFVAATGTDAAANGTVVWQTTDGGDTWTLVTSHAPPLNSRTASGVNFPGGIIGCPTHPLAVPPRGDPPPGLIDAAVQNIETTRGWTPAGAPVAYRVGTKHGAYSEIFNYQVPSCGQSAVAASWVVELYGAPGSGGGGSTPQAQLALSHSSDGWHVFGRYH